MTVLDASAVIAHLNPSDAHHRRAGELLLASAVLTIHPVTMAEVLVGAARVGRAVELQSALTEVGITVARPDETEPLRVAELRARTGLKLPDCYPLALALERNEPLATFDAQLRTAAERQQAPVAWRE